jgi:hypothetical protein
MYLRTANMTDCLLARRYEGVVGLSMHVLDPQTDFGQLAMTNNDQAPPSTQLIVCLKRYCFFTIASRI